MHAPAPWKIVPGESRRVYLVNDSKNQAIGEIVYTDTRNPDDAKLIAAAPELLAALAWLLEDLQLHAPKLGPLRSIAAAQALRESLL